MQTNFFRRAEKHPKPWMTRGALNIHALCDLTNQKFGKDFVDLNPDEREQTIDAWHEVVERQNKQHGHVDEGAKAVWIDLGQIIDDAARQHRYNGQPVDTAERLRLYNLHGSDVTQPVPSSQFHVVHHSGGRIDVTPDEVRYQGQAGDDLQAVYAGMVHAKRQKWEAVEVGENSRHDFKLKMWCSARKQGLKVANFRPGVTDLLRVRAIMKELDYHLTPKATGAANPQPNTGSGPNRPNSINQNAAQPAAVPT